VQHEENEVHLARGAQVGEQLLTQSCSRARQRPSGLRPRAQARDAVVPAMAGDFQHIGVARELARLLERGGLPAVVQQAPLEGLPRGRQRREGVGLVRERG
jgi:hypothetical protein